MVMLWLGVPYFSWFEIEKTVLIFGNAMFFFNMIGKNETETCESEKHEISLISTMNTFRYLFSLPGLNFASHDSMMVLLLFFTPTSGGKMSKRCSLLYILEPCGHFRSQDTTKFFFQVGEGGHLRELRVGLEPLQSEGWVNGLPENGLLSDGLVSWT